MSTEVIFSRFNEISLSAVSPLPPDQFQPLSLKAFGLPLVLQHRPCVFAWLERA